jgi:hypothetical protein
MVGAAVRSRTRSPEGTNALERLTTDVSVGGTDADAPLAINAATVAATGRRKKRFLILKTPSPEEVS